MYEGHSIDKGNSFDYGGIYLLNDPLKYYRCFPSKKNSPFLLNDPRKYERSFLNQKNSLYLLNDPRLFNKSFQS